MPSKVFYCSSIQRCHLSRYYGTLVCSFFERNGFKLVNNPNEAEIIVINTCGSLNTREREAISLINDHRDKYLNSKKIIIIGCLVKIKPSLGQPVHILRKLTLIGPKELYKFDQIFRPKVAIENLSVNRLLEGQGPFGEAPKIHSFYRALREENYCILICEGCAGNCAYCAIKKAKGNVKSKSLNLVIKEFNRGLKHGAKLFTLLGDDCGSYGFDIGTNFAELINTLCRVKGDYRINVNYFEPFRLQVLWPKINKDVFKKLYSLRSSLESFNPRILALMNRYYDINEILKIIKEIKRLNPVIILRTELLFCYPTETRDEFLDMINHPALKYFNEVHFILYSAREGTPAANLKQITEKERMIRCEILTRMIKNRKNFSLQFLP